MFNVNPKIREILGITPCVKSVTLLIKELASVIKMDIPRRKKKKILDKSEKNSKIKVWGASSAPLSFKGDRR